MSLKVGDRVNLKTGSPEMAVEEIDGEDIRCVWFDKARCVRNTFNANTLIQARDVIAELRAKIEGHSKADAR